jgi:hypothetical protein
VLTQAEAIFVRAQQAWVQRAVPRYESFRIACDLTFLEGKCAPGDTVEFTVRLSDGRTFARTLPEPGDPSRVLMHGDYIYGPDGTPLGFYRALPQSPGGAVPPPPPNMAPDPMLPTIAQTTVSGQAYAIALTGKERLGDYQCDHLTLRPLLDPARFALRELWIDESTRNVVQLVYAHQFENGRWGTVRYRFAPEGTQEIWMIVHIEADDPTGALLGPRVDSIASDLNDISFPDSMPQNDFTP